MSSDKHIIRNSVIATVVGGLLLSFTLWLIGCLPIVWGWTTLLSKRSWAFLGTGITIPVWAAILVLMLVVPTVVFLFRRLVHLQPGTHVDEETSSNTVSFPELTDLEFKVLLVFARADGKSLQLDSIADRVGENRLRTTQALDSLVSKHVIVEQHNYLYGTSFCLSRLGRDLAIQKRMA